MRLGATFNQLVATCSRDLGVTSVASWPVVSVSSVLSVMNGAVAESVTAKSHR